MNASSMPAAPFLMVNPADESETGKPH